MTEKFPQIPYLPGTEDERQEMLKTIGVRSFEELVAHIPQSVRAKALDIAEGLSELELTKKISELASKNNPASQQFNFLGGGSYRRFVPAAVASIVSRSEFATAYTPYQPEVSQGTLQCIYEFQTAICLLTGLDVANASMYDGPTACAEATLMAARVTGRSKIVALEGVGPEYRMVAHTYVRSCGLDWHVASMGDGVTKTVEVDDQTACVIVQYPNFFGCLEDLSGLAKSCHDKGALLIVVTEPLSLGLLTSPAELGADIAVGDAQPCGNFLSFGGPSAGYIACKKDYIRQLPGRLAGMTVDNRGQRAFTLTLQTREQHIRRANATSNICTNQALNALAMLVYLTLVGPSGIRQLANVSVQRAHYLAEKLTAIPGVKLLFKSPFFNEFAIATEKPANQVLLRLRHRGILGGIDLSATYPKLTNAILVAVTEMNSPEELEAYAETLAEVLLDESASSKSRSDAKVTITTIEQSKKTPVTQGASKQK